MPNYIHISKPRKPTKPKQILETYLHKNLDIEEGIFKLENFLSNFNSKIEILKEELKQDIQKLNGYDINFSIEIKSYTSYICWGHSSTITKTSYWLRTDFKYQNPKFEKQQKKYNKKLEKYNEQILLWGKCKETTNHDNT
jgi:hypothetical protein